MSGEPEDPGSDGDRITGRATAELLDVPWPSSFARVRSRMQKVLVLKSGDRVLTVPELGGIKYPGMEWTFSRSRAAAFKRRLGGSDA